MTRGLTLFVLVSGLALGGAEPPSQLALVQPGQWDISGMPGTAGPLRQCITDIGLLARYEHRSKSCTARVLRESGDLVEIDYSCRGAGFGHSQVTLITPRSLRIETQGMSDGLPFNYVLQARRVGDCQPSLRH